MNIYDDATIDPRQRGTINIDDEGSFGSRTVLVENGILKNYMQDRLNSEIMGHNITGNGRRESFRHSPMPRMTNKILRYHPTLNRLKMNQRVSSYKILPMSLQMIA